MLASATRRDQLKVNIERLKTLTTNLGPRYVVANIPAARVEAIEEEMRDRVPGFRIDDDDLEDLRTVRDAVDYVSAKVEAA